jgi:subtilisin family serine protease
MPLKALNEWGSGTLANVANAIYYAADNGAKVINLSLGAPGSAYPCPGFEAVGEAMQYALSRGSLVVAAAGNEYAAAVSCPAALDQAMAVGSTTSTDARSSFSNYGAQLDIAAPGSSIYSTLWIKDFGATYGYKSGTSMATPHVAGLAALVWSFAPTLTNGQVRDLIQSTAADRGPAGWDVEFGYGRINAAAALGMRAQRSTGLYLPLAIAGSATANTTVTVQTISPTPITWAAAISPPVGWLSLSGSSSGTVSASSPAVITLRGSSLPSYPETSTNLVITGVTAAGKPAPTVTVVINRTSTQVFLPLIMK